VLFKIPRGRGERDAVTIYIERQDVRELMGKRAAVARQDEGSHVLHKNNFSLETILRFSITIHNHPDIVVV